MRDANIVLLKMRLDDFKINFAQVFVQTTANWNWFLAGDAVADRIGFSKSFYFDLIVAVMRLLRLFVFFARRNRKYEDSKIVTGAITPIPSFDRRKSLWGPRCRGGGA